LQLEPAEQVFGMVVTNTSSPQIDFRLTNTGNVPTGAISGHIEGPGFFLNIEGTFCASNLDPGAFCTIPVVFRPTQAADYDAMLVVTTAAGGAISSQLTGTGISGGMLTVSQPLLDFGWQAQGLQAYHQSVIVRNAGQATVTIGSVTLSGQNADDFLLTTSNDCVDFDLGQSTDFCTVDVIFAPKSPGEMKSALVTIAGDHGEMVSVMLTGNATQREGLEILPVNTDFGVVDLAADQELPRQSFSVRLLGEGSVFLNLSIEDPEAVNSDFRNFFLDRGNCPRQLTIDVPSCTVTVIFEPFRSGKHAGYLRALGTNSDEKPVAGASAHMFGSAQCSQFEICM
jgi:hypothetical protein